MSLRKYIFDAFVLFLLLINVAEGVYILKIVPLKDQNRGILIQNRLAETSASCQAGFLVEDVQEIIDSCKILGLDMQGKDVFVFVPPNCCSACADRQNSILIEMGSRYSEKQIGLIVPENRRRDYMAVFAELKNVHVIEYQSDFGDFSFDGYVYYTQRDGRVRDFFLSDKSFPET